ncbi:DUF2206 domain-containing protein [Methanobacterium congolense]|uniref:DUF2206 domain-containing protein n=1 Tax=Methanobacterium congolense TaxID=118062 RepID=A0A1D3L4B7_9EURY|nr:DUF2206 domain-containing protein [Methanobacterium congolense]SCG86396.1 putative protein [Methanobacterium congolense]
MNLSRDPVADGSKTTGESLVISWNIRRLLFIIMCLQVSIWGLYGIQSLSGFNVPFLSQILPFIYLTFVPGVLLLRVLRFDNLNGVERLIYSVGSSLVVVMSVGLVTNYFLLLIGISKPLSVIYILTVMTILVAILSALAYVRGDPDNFYSVDLKEYLNLTNIILVALPFLTILGTYMINVYGNNTLIFLTLSLIAVVPLLAAFDKMSEKSYPLAVFVVSLSLLFHISLISNFIYGRDAFYEYYVSTITLKNLYWTPNLSYELNALMSITILPTIYQKFCNVSLAYVFKAIYPFLFALVPLTLYELFRKYVCSKNSFLACFFMVSIISFYAEMPQLLRQEIGEIFFVLSILLLMDSKLDETRKYFLLVLFLVGITFSHYSMAYYFAFIILCTAIFHKLIKTGKIRAFHQKLKDVGLKKVGSVLALPKLETPSHVSINISYVVLVVVFILSWYIFVSRGTTYIDLVAVAASIYNNLVSEFLDIGGSEAMNIALTGSQTYITLKIVTAFNLLATFFISLGLFYSLYMGKKGKSVHFIPEYLILSIINFVLWILAIVVPYFSSILTANRLYHITLLILSPFVIIGGVKFFGLFRIGKTKALKLLSVCLVVFYVFNVGMVGSIIGEETSMGLDSSVADFPRANQGELVGARWLASHKLAGLQSFGDMYRMPIMGAFDWDKVDDFPKNVTWIGGNYIYLGTVNTDTGTALINGGRFSGGEYVSLNPWIGSKNRIYDNGKATIYK